MGDYWDEEVVKTAVANQSLGIKGEHPATFPILQTSNMCYLVLDPSCGSGNVGRVCDVLERNFVGFDLKEY
jgi:DNA modification methylase|tara:strand:- start:781 stop:993 length:213 start_codon:yes stop_codon:yes gene_type:complete